MVERISIDTYLKEYEDVPIIDVRSPGEFQKGHIPKAFNIPLFSNEERARVGTVYKQQSKEKAIELGYVFVNPKLEIFITESRSIAPTGVIAVHCWRGGMRSEAFANHLNDNGFTKVYVIEKGYKAFRNYVQSFFDHKFRLIVLGGFTGSGKTEILKNIAQQGNQVIDLERIANHKGSAFGGIGQKEQPSSEHFENLLYYELRKFKFDKPIWVEDESINIGQVCLPQNLFLQMRAQSVYFIEIPRNERAKYLASTYGNQNKEKLEAAILKISKRLGPLNTKNAIDLLRVDDYAAVAELSLIYYDKSYLVGLHRREEHKVVAIKLPKVDAHENATRLLELVKNEWNG